MSSETAAAGDSRRFLFLGESAILDGMGELYTTLLYQPLFNLLIWLYTVVPGQSIGLAIIALTILVKLLLYPLTVQSLRAQRSLQQIQPKMAALKKQHGSDKEGLSKAMIELYRQEKVNPLSSCLPVLIQLPFLIAMYQVFRQGLSNGSFDLLYSFVVNPQQIDPFFFGMNLSQPHIGLAILAGAAQFLQAKMLPSRHSPKTPDGQAVAPAADEDMAAMMNKQMLYVMPLMTVFIGWRLPGGLTLYWFVTTVLTVLQQWYFLRRSPAAATPPPPAV